MGPLSRLRAAWEELWIACFAWIPTPLGLALRWLAWRWLFDRCGSVRFGTGLSFVGCRHMRLGDAVRLGRGCIITAGDGELVLGDRVSISPYAHVAADGGRIVMGRHVAVGPGTVLRAANHCFSRHDVPILQQGHHPGEIVRGRCLDRGQLRHHARRAHRSGRRGGRGRRGHPRCGPFHHRGRCSGTSHRPPRPRRMSGTVIAPGGGSVWLPASPAFFQPGRRPVPLSGSGPQGSVRLGGGARACFRILPVRRRP